MVVHDPAIYAWRAADEQAVCASAIGKHPEAFNLCRRLLGRADIPDDHRNRIAANRDVSVSAMLEATRCTQKRWCATLSTDHATPT